jgi:hypothetical protein
MPVRTSFVLQLVVALTAFAAVSPTHAQTIAFAGYNWDVRSGQGGPGPNTWNPNNVFVDATGALHLKITNANGVWQCAELTLNQRLGFGTYEFDVASPVDHLDPNVVLGLFDYPTPDVGPDGTNEIDIEFSHWGNANNPIGNYTVWPPVAGTEPATHAFSFAQTNSRSTHLFTWTPYFISFLSLTRYPGGNLPGYSQWMYRPVNAASHIPQHPLPVHLNLWLFQGHAPTNGLPVELVITGFHFTPQSPGAAAPR